LTRDRLERRAWRLSLFTVLYNLLEGTVAVVAGAGAGSAALVGFGADSFVESLSGGVMLWRFGRSHGDTEDAERRAARLVGYTFFVLAAYVAFDAGRSLLLGERPEVSPVGIGLAVLSLAVMPALYVVKRRTADRLNSPSFRADSKQTLACTMLSLALLVGLGLHAAFGIWQADALIGLLISGVLVREGREAIREGRMCAC
jgi:divalent metal cation (Fe/Co/Zn/Cd) transporter